jgi:hypothetical protein
VEVFVVWGCVVGMGGCACVLIVMAIILPNRSTRRKK